MDVSVDAVFLAMPTVSDGKRQTLNLTFEGRMSGRESRGRIFFNGIGTKAAAEADAVTAASSAQNV
jgi:hypothetical protein